MFRLDAERPVEFCDGSRRRDFLHAGSLSLLGLGLTELFGLKALGAVERRVRRELHPADAGRRAVAARHLGHEAQRAGRDPRTLQADQDQRPGHRDLAKTFPRMAKHADKYALIRSVYHTAAAVHDTGHQMMQTGRLFQGGIEHPHIGCVVSQAEGPEGRRAAARAAAAPHRQHRRQHAARPERRLPGQDVRSVRAERRSVRPELPRAGHAAAGLPCRRCASTAAGTGARWSTRPVSKFETSQDARLLDSTFHQAYTLMSSQKAREAFELHREPEKVREKYGLNRFGQSCLLARRLIEAGVRFVTVNMFETVFDEITWDIHGSKPFSPISCYRDLVGPMFDMAYSSLLEDLQRARTAGQHDGGGDGRIRPHAQGESGRRARPLAAMLDHADGRRRRQGRAGRRRVGRDRRDARRTGRSRRREVAATIYHGARHRPGHGTARRAGPADSAGRPRRRADPGTVRREDPAMRMFLLSSRRLRPLVAADARRCSCRSAWS